MTLEITRELARRALETDNPCHAVEEGPGGIWILTLWGALPVGWAGNLAQNCAAARMSVRDGEAVRLAPGRWAGVFRLSPEPARSADDGRPLAARPGWPDRDPAHDDEGVAARQFDFAAMSLRRPRNVAPVDSMRLDKATVEIDPESVEVVAVVEAEDRMGLLGFVLGELAALCLFPARLSVRTEGARVRDRFVLTGVGGSPPSARAVRGLEVRLGALCGGEPGAGTRRHGTWQTP